MPILIVALVIGIIMATTAILPLASDYSEAKTFKNEGYYTMDPITDDTNRVITWEKATPNKITIDGVDFDMSFSENNKSYTLIGSDSVVVRYEKETNLTGVQMFSNITGSTYTSFHTNTATDAGDKITITVNSSTVTVLTNGTSPFNKTANIGNDGYVINGDNNGAYSFVMKKADIPAHVLGDSEIKFIGVSVAAGPTGIALYGTGTFDDGITLTTIYKADSVTSVTYSDPVPTYTEVTSYKDLYTLDKYNFTITYDTSTFDATYSYFIVPSEVTAEPDNPDTYKNLIKIVPLMAFIMLVVAAAAMINSKRD